MGRLFSQSGSDRIHVGTLTALDGFDFRFGTIAACCRITSFAGNANTFLSTNAASGACTDVYVLNSGQMEWYDGTNGRTGSTAIVAATPYVMAFTKATGTQTPRFHQHRFSTGAWVHENGGGTSVDSASNTQVTIGAYQDAGSSESFNGDIWALAVWVGKVFSDNEVKRLARGDWGQLGADMFVQWDNGREVGDMARSYGRLNVRQTARTGTTRGTVKAPPGFRFSPVTRRR